MTQDMLTVMVLISLVVACVVISMAIANSAERLGDEVRNWVECEEDDDETR